jgi:hypothetical protein
MVVDLMIAKGNGISLRLLTKIRAERNKSLKQPKKKAAPAEQKRKKARSR